MALNYEKTYPGQITSDPTNYPQGKPKDQVVEGDGTGTPWEERLVQDLFGFLQACVAQGRITINGLPDTAVVSDYLAGLRVTMRERFLLFDWLLSVGSLSDLEFEDSTGGNMTPVGAYHHPIGDNWIICGTGGGINISRDGGRAFSTFDNGVGTEELRAIAGAGTVANPSLVIATVSEKFVYVMTDYFSDADGDWTASADLPDVLNLKSVVYEPLTDRYIVVGLAEDGGSQNGGYFATSTNNTGTTYISRPTPVSFQVDSASVGDVVVGPPGILVAVGLYEHTKVAFSSDGGITWSDSATTFANKRWRVAYSQARKAFYLIEASAINVSAHELYTSIDGDNWTLVSNVDPSAGTMLITAAAVIGSNEPDRSLIAAYGGALFVRGLDPDLQSSGVSFSVDGGLTWDQLPTVRGFSNMLTSDLAGNRAFMATSKSGAHLGRIV